MRERMLQSKETENEKTRNKPKFLRRILCRPASIIVAFYVVLLVRGMQTRDAEILYRDVKCH